VEQPLRLSIKEMPMLHKRVLFESMARERLLRGASALADALRVTLGPKSTSVVIEKECTSPEACDDGGAISHEFDLEDPEENMGVRMIRHVAERTAEAVGDGATTSMLLAYAILAENVRNMVAGASAIDIKHGLERGLAIALASQQEISRPVGSRRETGESARIFAHNDTAMGKSVADAIKQVGGEGLVGSDQAHAAETILEVINDMQIDSGYASSDFITDGERMECVLIDPLILVYPHKLAVLADLIPFLETMVRSGRPLLVIADEIEGEALATLVVAKLRGILSCCAVKAPGYGDRRPATIEDIAILTGASLVSEDRGKRLTSTGLGDLGQASRVVIGEDTTTIIGGGGDKQRVQDRIAQIRAEITATESPYDQDLLSERLAKLTGEIADPDARAASESALKSFKEAFDDAINATKAAIVEDIVPVSGFALLRAIPALEHEEERCSGDVRTGLRILRRALEAPTRQIAKNPDLDDGVEADQIGTSHGAVGMDVTSGRYLDLVEAGIVDPTKVVRVALENAVSVASLLLLCEAALMEQPEKPRNPNGFAPMSEP